MVYGEHREQCLSIGRQRKRCLRDRAVTAAIASGIDPLYVGELVREAIEGDWPHIFTDLQFEPHVDARFATIKQGFDRIRDRTPRY